MNYLIQLDQLIAIENLLQEGHTLTGLDQLDNLLKHHYNETTSSILLKAYLLKANIFEIIGEYQEAYELFESLLTDNKFMFSNIKDKDLLLEYYQILIGLSRVIRILGDLKKSFEYAENAYKGAEENKQLLVQLQALNELATIEALSGNYDEAQLYVAKGLNLSKFLPNMDQTKYWENKFFSIRSQLDYYKGQYHEAVVNNIRVISTAKDFHDMSLFGNVHNHLSMVYRTIGEFDLALEESEIAIEIAQKLNDQSLLAYAISNKGRVLIHQGEFNVGLDLLNEALAIAQESHNKVGEAKIFGDISKTLLNMGDFLKAKETFNQTLRLYEQIGLEIDLVDKICYYVDLLIETDTLVEAEKQLDRCTALVKKHNSKLEEIKLLIRLGMYQKAIGNSNKAKGYFTDARALAETIDQYKDTIRASIYLAELDLEHTLVKGLEKQAFNDALANVDKALYLSERVGLFPYIVRTLIIKGSLLGAHLEFTEALKSLDEAIRIANQKKFDLLLRRAMELSERLKQRQNMPMLPHQSKWEELGTQEVLNYIRLMTGRKPTLPPNIEQLDTVYLSAFEFEPYNNKMLFFDPLPSEALPKDRPFDPTLIGIFFSSVLGGNHYNQGLFGPIPIPDLNEFQALVYTKVLALSTAEGVSSRYFMLVMIYPKIFDPLYYNRYEYENLFSESFQNIKESNIKEQLNEMFFLKLKNQIKDVIQRQVFERTKDW